MNAAVLVIKRRQHGPRHLGPVRAHAAAAAGRAGRNRHVPGVVQERACHQPRATRALQQPSVRLRDSGARNSGQRTHRAAVALPGSTRQAHALDAQHSLAAVGTHSAAMVSRHNDAARRQPTPAIGADGRPQSGAVPTRPSGKPKVGKTELGSGNHGPVRALPDTPTQALVLDQHGALRALLDSSGHGRISSDFRPDVSENCANLQHMQHTFAM